VLRWYITELYRTDIISDCVYFQTGLNYRRDDMGFLRQLGLLLWKNFTLKKRSPVCFYMIFAVVKKT